MKSLRIEVLILSGIVAANALGSVNAGEGKRIYEEHCASCHGRQLEGADDWDLQREDLTFPPPPHDRTGHTWHHSDRFLADYIKHGGRHLDTTDVRTTMPGFAGTLTDAEIVAVIAYIKSHWPKEIRDGQARQNTNPE